MTEEGIVTVEINGVKMDVDMRHAVVHKNENLKVGDYVKVLKKAYSGYEAKPGVIVGFDAFKAEPTIIVALIGHYGSTDITYVYYNNKTSEEVEIIKANEEDQQIDRTVILNNFDRAIERKQFEIHELKEKRAFFCRYFGRSAEAAEEAKV